ncbi:cAMP phosphodiesterase [Prochlorococcus marinus]|uniref:cAMP phosphodiesterase n=1 Tax=Prochlorococcus marinus TaxID=1219 RepID=UPI0022B3CAD8|nr:cAMP phosphodiesterase [Prochlorococcus marinus]
MKFLLALACSLSFCSTALANESQAGFSRSRTCTRNEYREQYFPGTEKSPGYVKSWNETVEVPCKGSSANYKGAIPQDVDNNDCKEGSLIGGLLGAGLTMSGTRGKDRWWAVPAGGAAGAMIGCSIDGG